MGDLTGIDLDAVLAGTLGSWTGGQAGPVPGPPPGTDNTGRVVIVDRPGAVQTQLLIGRIGPDRHDPVWPALQLGIYCLGGTLTSRLDRVLREEKGYTYGVQAFPQVLRSPAPDGVAAAPGASALVISGAVDTASTAPALADTWSVLRTLAADGLTDPERDQAVQNLVGVAPLRYERASSVADTLADQVEEHLPDDYQAQLYARLASTSTGAATAAVVAAFPASSLVTILVGDAAQIREPVQALGIGAVTVAAGWAPGRRRGQRRARHDWTSGPSGEKVVAGDGLVTSRHTAVNRPAQATIGERGPAPEPPSPRDCGSAAVPRRGLRWPR